MFAHRVLLIVGSPAGAVFSENTIGCQGSALITDENGMNYNIDAEDVRVTVPRNGSAQWQGSTGTPVHNHSGEIFLDLGLFDVPIDDWGSANVNELSANGTASLPDALGYAPPGIYAVAGFHEGDEGRCSGRIEIELEGEGNTWLFIVIGATILFGLGTFWAGFPKGA